MKNKNKQTKFPVARIKKIMQKDEEVGKVAQATPIVISKALELFLALVIEKSSAVTVERGSKKVEVYHLKNAVENTERLDFLKELVQDVPDPSCGGTVDLEAENQETKKKRGKGKRAAAAAAATGDASSSKTTKPVDPNAPPKKRRRRKKDAEVAAVAVAAAPAEVDVKMATDGGNATEGEDDAAPMSAVGAQGRMDEMQEDPDEYDEDDRMMMRPPPTGPSSYRLRSPGDEGEDY